VLKVCPVDQPHAYADDFGAPRIGHRHAGNDVVAPMGTPIRAPFDGNAVATPNGLGGQAVTVFGALGYVYNAHLSQYGALGPVTTGTVIGYVGTTGDAQGGIPHNHFEWHPNVIPQPLWVSPYGYSLINGAIDPFPYLNSVC
jgi:murein DD-endopeptidase MepM/ murein hydrolase activator NlpD